MAGRFAGIPNIPTDGLADWQAQIFSAIKENVELLIGIRGEADLASAAIIRGNITVSSLSTQDMRQNSSVGRTWSGISGLPAGESVADGEDFIALRADLQTLANDVAVTRETINVLLGQLKGQEII